MQQIPTLRRWLAIVLTALLGMTGLTLVMAPSASAATWTSYPTATGPRLCTSTRVYSNVYYQTCLDYSGSARSQVRAIMFASATTAGYVSVSGTMQAASGAISFSCANTYFSAGTRRACSSGWQNASAVMTANTSTSINGSAALRLRVAQSKLAGKAQETGNYCGVAVIQAALWRMGFSVPSQTTIANYVLTNWYGMTLPSKMDDGLNHWMGTASYKYVQYDWSSTTDSINRMAASISRNRPTPLLVRPHDLPGGAGGVSLVRHWLLVDGYAGTISPAGTLVVDRVSYWDPASTATKTLTSSELQAAAQGAGITSVGQITFVSS